MKMKKSTSMLRKRRFLSRAGKKKSVVNLAGDDGTRIINYSIHFSTRTNDHFEHSHALLVFQTSVLHKDMIIGMHRLDIDR